MTDLDRDSLRAIHPPRWNNTDDSLGAEGDSLVRRASPDATGAGRQSRPARPGTYRGISQQWMIDPRTTFRYPLTARRAM